MPRRHREHVVDYSRGREKVGTLCCTIAEDAGAVGQEGRASIEKDPTLHTASQTITRLINDDLHFVTSFHEAGVGM